MVARIDRIDGDDRQVPQILALVRAQRQFRRQFRLGQHVFGEEIGNAVLVDGDQAESARGQRIAEHFGDFDPRTRATPRRFGQHQLAFLGPAQIGNRRGIAHALVHRREPGLSRPVELDHAEQLVRHRGQLLHRMGAPAGTGFLGAREHPVADFQRAVFALLDHAQARRRGGVIGLPIVRDSNRLAVLDVGHPQHGHSRHPAHGMKRGPPAVDQAFIGHIAQQGLERDLLLPFEPERARNLALAGGRGGAGDEIEDLLGRGQAGSGIGQIIES